MALDTAPLLSRNKKFAYKLETTTGTFISLSATNATTRVLNPAVNYDIETIEREDTESLSDPAAEFGARMANVTFQTWAAGSGTSGSLPAWADLLKACGMSFTSLVASPVTGATDSLSFGLYFAGSRAKYAAGCMGNAVFKMTRGQHMTIDWNFSGKYVAPAAASLTTPTYESVIAPRGAATFTIGGTTYRCPDFEFDLGNTVIMREDVSETTTGYRAAYITNRSPRFRVTPEASALGTKDWFSDMLAGTTSAGVITIGSSAGNTISISMPKLQLVTSPKETDRNGMLAETLEFKPIRNTDAGNDEYTITFS